MLSLAHVHQIVQHINLLRLQLVGGKWTQRWQTCSHSREECASLRLCIKQELKCSRENIEKIPISVSVRGRPIIVCQVNRSTASLASGVDIRPIHSRSETCLLLFASFSLPLYQWYFLNVMRASSWPCGQTQNWLSLLHACVWLCVFMASVSHATGRAEADVSVAFRCSHCQVLVSDQQTFIQEWKQCRLRQ